VQSIAEDNTKLREDHTQDVKEIFHPPFERCLEQQGKEISRMQKPEVSVSRLVSPSVSSVVLMCSIFFSISEDTKELWLMRTPVIIALERSSEFHN